MRVVIFGASGMVGQGVLLECLDQAEVRRVLVVGRSSCGVTHPKLEEVLHQDFLDYSTVENRLAGLDACFFCLGVSAAGMSEDTYRRITSDFTLAAAEVLLRLNPGLCFIYVSGTGSDDTGTSRMMWARVKGEVENRLLAMPFGAAYMFRPGFIQPLRGIRSKTAAYRAVYAVLGPLFPLFDRTLPRMVTTTERVGRAMIRVVREGSDKKFLENSDINTLAASR
ncbi:MAG: epimerase [Pseudomonadota bacterium]